PGRMPRIAIPPRPHWLPVTSRPDSIRRLPDVAFDAAALARPLDWVGMSNIALPLRVASAGETITVPAAVDVSVDLRDASARGIHMSRLYLELQHAFASETATPARLRRVLHTFLD